MNDYNIREGLQRSLIRLRKQHGMNQTEAGAIVGVPKTTYATWEQGRSLPDVENLYKLAQFYGVSMDEIYGVVTVEQTTFDSAELASRLSAIAQAIHPDTFGVKKVVIDVKERNKEA